MFILVCVFLAQFGMVDTRMDETGKVKRTALVGDNPGDCDQKFPQ